MNGQKVVMVMLVLVGLLFMVPGICVIHFLGKPMLDRARQSDHWPVTEGDIITSRVIREYSGNDAKFSAEVLYRYTVNEQVMEGDQIWIGGAYSTSDRKEFQRVVNDFSVGEKVQVHYNPDDPVDSVLIPGVFTSSYIVYIVGWVMVGLDVVFFAFLITIVSWYIRSEKSKKQMEEPADSMVEIG